MVRACAVQMSFATFGSEGDAPIVGGSPFQKMTYEEAMCRYGSGQA